VTSCATHVTGDQVYLCSFGTALTLVAQDQTSEAIQKLIPLARDHPYDYIYALIGDLYQVNNQLPTAQIYYEKAINASYN